MSDLASRLAALSPAKRELLARRLQGRLPLEDLQGIPRRTGAGPVPLCLAQERLWFLNQLQPDSVAYNISQALKLTGALDLRALRGALDALLARHESLRTTFPAVDGKPVQVVGPAGPFELPVVDLSGREEAERGPEAQRLVAEEAWRPFDLSQRPLIRALLIRFGTDEHVLLLAMHHIISDGWSMAVLLGELSALYRAFVCGGQPALRELPIQYADFALWQRGSLLGDVLERQLSYWKKQLSGSPLVLDLPSDRPRPPVHTFRGAEHRSVWPHELAEALAAVGLRAGATPFMTLFAAFTVLLHRCTGRDDLLVGSPIAGRTMVETEGLIGFFVNTLVLRTDLSGNPSFLELLGRVRETALAAYEHQDIPFDRLVAELQPERSGSHMPLVQVMFGFQQSPDSWLKIPGVAVTPIPVETRGSKLDLSFELLDTPSGLAARIEYSTDLFDSDTIARMAEHYRVLLEGIAANPQARVGELPLLAADERRRLESNWSGAASHYLEAPSVGQLFEAWAARTPKAIAAIAGDGRLTYRELNARANQLARRLQKLGVGPDVLVGVCVERSLEMAVAFLAVLKAGGAYVPLDPHYPAARLAHMLEDTQAPVVLTQKHLRASLPPHKGALLCLDADRGETAAESTEDTPPTAGPDNLAYVIYTSGSTGSPKGVAVPHRAILRLVVHTDYLAIKPSDVVAQASSISFDAATFEIWGPLLNGARFVEVPTDVLLSPRDLAAEIDRQGITTLFVTTALFNRIADEFPQAFRKLRCLLFGGEASDPDSVAKVLREAPPARLLHVYGPTEATTFATWHPVEKVVEGARTIPIGRPIANTTVLLLDRYLNPVPVGVLGELHIGGPGLARGYLNRPGLTAARFIPDPLSPSSDARLYKTGDVARYLPDGSIELLGRLDDQVKIRGLRVEPGEIEFLLRKHPAVSDAVVIARENSPGDKRLLAYLVASGQPFPPEHDLRAFLAGKLPEYMIPSAFVVLDRLPLTPNGKVDRGALPAPVPAAATRQAARLAPRNLLEEELAQMWRDVLGVPQLGLDESFFDLGGHSLLAVQLFARIEKAFNRRLPIATLFEAPTVAKLAVVLGRRGWSGNPFPAVALGTTGAGLPFFCVSPMDAFGFLHLTRHMRSDRPFYVLHPLGCVDHEKPEFSIASLAAEYAGQVRSIQPKGPYLLGGHSVGGVVAFEMAQQLQQQGERVAVLALFDTWYPTRGWRYWVNRIAGRRFVRHLRALWRRKHGEWLAYLRCALGTRRQRERHAGVRGEAAPGEANPAKLYWRPFRNAYVRALAQYVPKPYAGRPIMFLSSKEAKQILDPRLMWRRVATEGLEVLRLPGDHLTLMREPSVCLLAEALGSRLANAQADERG